MILLETFKKCSHLTIAILIGANFLLNRPVHSVHTGTEINKETLQFAKKKKSMKKINQSFPGCKNMITELQTKELSLGKKYLSHTIFIAKFLIQFYVVSKYLF